jgi:AcrR family transcriptional regulator
LASQSDTARPPRLHTEVVQSRKRERILAAFARLLVVSTYEGVNIAHVVQEAGVARKTLYDNYAGKEHVARALVERVSRDVAARLEDQSFKRRSLTVLTVELVAYVHADAPRTLAAEATDLLNVLAVIDLSTVKVPAADDPLRSQLPSGKHGLSGEFITSNQRHRLLAGLAGVVVDQGYRCTRIGDITRRGALSRRTFYEHSTGVDDLAVGLLGYAGIEEPDRRLLPIATEIVAEGLYGSAEQMAATVEAATAVLGELEAVGA